MGAAPLAARNRGTRRATQSCSPAQELVAITHLGGNAHVESFHQEGQANRSNVATLVWRLGPAEPCPFEITVSIEVPGHDGRSHLGTLELDLTLVSRLTAWRDATRSGAPPQKQRRRLEVREWADLLDSTAATLTSPDVVDPVADLAAVGAIEVRQPQVLHIRSGPEMAELLPPLRAIRAGGVSHGAHMLAEPPATCCRPWRCSGRQRTGPVQPRSSSTRDRSTIQGRASVQEAGRPRSSPSSVRRAWHASGSWPRWIARTMPAISLAPCASAVFRSSQLPAGIGDLPGYQTGTRACSGWNVRRV